MDKEIKTKEHWTNLHAWYMPRPRIDALLEQASNGKLLYLVAGAGYGKTQAVRHYVQQREDALVRWLQLRESDNVPARFWENLVRCVGGDRPDLARALRELGFPETIARFKQFAEIIRSMEPRREKTFFVLDDFHLIDAQEILNFVEQCANLQFSGLCVIILSRKEPEVNSVLLLAKGGICTIGEEALRFTPEESTQFFKLCGLGVLARDVLRVLEATKGWALAIDMFAQILKRAPGNVEHALEAVVQNIFKLLRVEAWDKFPQEVQEALLKLSLLSSLPIVPPELLPMDAKALADTPGLSSFVCFDSLTGDLKIHPIYLEFLQNKQENLSCAQTQETYRQAALWCAENGFSIDAMRYYAKSHQFDRMVEQLFSYPMRLPRETSEYFLDIIENISPKKEEDRNLQLLQNFFLPLLLLSADRGEEAWEKALAIAEKWEKMDSPEASSLLHGIYSSLAYIDMHLCTQTHSYQVPMFLEKAMEHFSRSAQPGAKLAETFINADVRAFACLVGEGGTKAELEGFLETAKQATALIEESPYSIYAGYEELVACEYAFFKNEPQVARNHAHAAILKAREKKQYSTVALAEKYLLRIAAQKGDAQLAKSILKQLGSHLDNTSFWNRQLYYDLYTGAFYGQIGFLDKVPQWFVLEEEEIREGIRIPARELYVSALYYIAAKKYQQALTILCGAYPRRPQERLLFGEIRLTLLRAVARLHTSDTAGAIEDFTKAHKASCQGEFELFFIELGKELHPLVHAVLKQKVEEIPEEWLKKMDRKASIYVKKMAVVANAFQNQPENNKMLGTLSEREREILIDLYHGLSREEIAENQYLSINTVKKALQSIFTKLDAHNSVDAVRIALEKKLIE